MNSAEPGQAGILELFLPLIIISVPIAIIAYLLAREKDRSVGLWLLLSFVPLINIWCLAYFVGTSNRRIENKLDAIMTRLEITDA